MRFEVDGGPVLRFEWAMIGIGTPDYHRRCKRKKDLDCTEEERQWTTVQTTFGEVMAFRREAAPVPAPAQAELRLLPSSLRPPTKRPSAWPLTQGRPPGRS
jgi:hypothetical protein